MGSMDLLDCFDLYDFFILVVSAVRANMVRPLDLMALGALTVSRNA